MTADEHEAGSVQEDLTISFKAIDATLPESEDLHVALAELDSHDAMLFVKRGPNVGATYLLDTDVTRAGRHPENEVFLDDVTVSRKHAEFIREGDEFAIVDVGSLNGTYLNGDRIDRGTLKRGDEVQIGKFKFLFLTGNAE